MSGNVARSWDAEYTAGRYREDAPVGFVDDIIAAAADHQVRRGLYIGCGNGRNLVPLLDAGLDLVGLDVSGEAIKQLCRRRPDRAGYLVRGDLSALPAASRYELVIGIQVFQHGTRRRGAPTPPGCCRASRYRWPAVRSGQCHGYRHRA